MKNLKEQIKESRSIKENSLNTYMCALHILYKRITGEKIDKLPNAKFLKDYDTVMDAIEKEKKLTSKKNKLTAVLVALNSEKPKRDELIEKLAHKLKMLGDTYMTFLKQQKKTETQEKNWLEYNQVIEIANELNDDVKMLRINKKINQELTNKEFDKLQQLLILRTYLQFPVRNDFADMLVITNKELKKIPKEEQDKKNYLILYPKNKKEFHINQFKNKKAMGSKILKIPSQLNKIINLWLKFNKSGYYLVKIHNRTEPMSPNSITKYLNRIFKKHANGKKISSSMLRHIIISHMLEGTKTIKEKEDEKKEIEDKFMHSKDMNEQYRKV